MERDGFTCRECRDKESPLHVHHCYYLKGKNPWEYPAEDLITLCETCHNARGKIEHAVKLEFSRLMRLHRAHHLVELLSEIVRARETLEFNFASGLGMHEQVSISLFESVRIDQEQEAVK